MTNSEYVERILAARVYDVAEETALEQAPGLSARTADYGRVLVGLQVPHRDDAAFETFLETLAFPYADESGNPVYRLFLR